VSLAVAAPATAEAKSVTPRHAGVYDYLRRHVIKKYGVRAAGRDILRDGRSDSRRVTDADVVESSGVMERMLAPPPTSYTAGAASTVLGTVGPSVVTGAGGCGGITPYPGGGQCWAIPYSIVSCESGGQDVPNAQGSPAKGYYQLEVGGTGSRAEQDQAAHDLWAGGAGASNWTCKG